MPFITSFEELGRETGRAEGQRDLVVRLLTRKLGPLPEDVLARIARLENDTVLLLADALLDVSTLTDLTAWLDQQPNAAPPGEDNDQDPTS